MLAKQNPYIASAYEQLQVISQDEQKRMEYDARLKAQLDHNQLMKEAKESGIQEGMAKGRKEGMAEGVKQGQRSFLETMLQDESMEQVASRLKISVEEIESILANN